MKAFSQYLMRDDKPRKERARRERYGGFETGLRHVEGLQEAGVQRLHAPAPGVRGGASHVLWGRVRPATEPVDVTIQRDTGDGWKRLTTTRTGAGGVFGLGTRARDERALPHALDARATARPSPGRRSAPTRR